MIKNFLTFKEFKAELNERKNIGTIYHFTKIQSLIQLIDKKKQTKYNLDIFEFFSHNGSFSCTRDGCLVNNVLSKDINLKNGYNVRIDLDGERISDNFKINPINGFNNNLNTGTRIGKEYQEREENVSMKMNTHAGDKTFKALKYINQIVFQNDILNDPLFDKDVIEKTLNNLKIPFKYVRKFHGLNESVKDYDYEILL